jgi:hypothetical protein
MPHEGKSGAGVLLGVCMNRQWGKSLDRNSGQVFVRRHIGGVTDNISAFLRRTCGVI